MVLAAQVILHRLLQHKVLLVEVVIGLVQALHIQAVVAVVLALLELTQQLAPQVLAVSASHHLFQELRLTMLAAVVVVAKVLTEVQVDWAAVVLAVDMLHTLPHQELQAQAAAVVVLVLALAVTAAAALLLFPMLAHNNSAVV
jgi:hypothetical protein